MAKPDQKVLTAHLRRLAVAGSRSVGLPDEELVRRFAERGDEAAFEAIVWRHGPMVWAACCRVLRHSQDTEDAFQATFLALACSARAACRQRSVVG